MAGGDHEDAAIDGADSPRVPPSLPHRIALETVPRPSGQRFGIQVWNEIRWSVTPPWIWLAGVGANLVLSFLWLIVQPLRGEPHHDWAVVIGTYFAVFILADVTSTNVLGADAARIRLGLLREVPFRRLLLIKNLTLICIVGIPTLVATAIITLNSEAEYRLTATLPGVAFPILTWLCVGNVVSVLLPVAAVPLRERWRRRHELQPTVRWLVHLAVPYALLPVVGPFAALPGILSRALVLPHEAAVHGAVVLTTGLVLWLAGTELAVLLVRRRGLHLR